MSRELTAEQRAEYATEAAYSFVSRALYTARAVAAAAQRGETQVVAQYLKSLESLPTSIGWNEEPGGTFAFFCEWCGREGPEGRSLADADRKAAAIGWTRRQCPECQGQPVRLHTRLHAWFAEWLTRRYGWTGRPKPRWAWLVERLFIRLERD